MKAFRFKNKQQTKMYTIYTFIAMALSIFIFAGLDIYINKQVAYLLVTLLSFISVMSAVKKAGKEFEEIMIQENDIKFYFQNKMKEPLILPRKDVLAIVSADIIEFNNEVLKEVIGRAYKNKLEKEEDWEELVKCFSNKTT